jgi:hypothetical protein
MAQSGIWDQAIGRMNKSVERANDLHDRRAYSLADYDEQKQKFDIARQRQALTEDVRRYDLGRDDTNRQFDAKTNMFREMLGRKMPDFFGAGSTPTMGGGGGFSMQGMSMGGQPMNDPGLDAATRNYLLRFLRG